MWGDLDGGKVKERGVGKRKKRAQEGRGTVCGHTRALPSKKKIVTTVGETDEAGDGDTIPTGYLLAVVLSSKRWQQGGAFRGCSL